MASAGRIGVAEVDCRSSIYGTSVIAVDVWAEQLCYQQQWQPLLLFQLALLPVLLAVVCHHHVQPATLQRLHMCSVLFTLCCQC